MCHNVVVVCKLKHPDAEDHDRQRMENNSEAATCFHLVWLEVVAVVMVIIVVVVLAVIVVAVVVVVNVAVIKVVVVVAIFVAIVVAFVVSVGVRLARVFWMQS